MAFNIGDVVQLNSGGPKMTVEKMRQDGNVDCVWFDGTAQKYGTFHANALKHYESPQGQSTRSGGPQGWMG